MPTHMTMSSSMLSLQKSKKGRKDKSLTLELPERRHIHWNFLYQFRVDSWHLISRTANCRTSWSRGASNRNVFPFQYFEIRPKFPGSVSNRTLQFPLSFLRLFELSAFLWIPEFCFPGWSSCRLNTKKNVQVIIFPKNRYAILSWLVNNNLELTCE